MQKWEYLRVEFWVPSGAHVDRLEVRYINGKDATKMISGGGLLGSPKYAKGELIDDFLARIGQEGWEAVGYAGHPHLLLLKRLIP